MLIALERWQVTVSLFSFFPLFFSSLSPAAVNRINDNNPWADCELTTSTLRNDGNIREPVTPQSANREYARVAIVTPITLHSPGRDWNFRSNFSGPALTSGPVGPPPPSLFFLATSRRRRSTRRRRNCDGNWREQEKRDDETIYTCKRENRFDWKIEAFSSKSTGVPRKIIPDICRVNIFEGNVSSEEILQFDVKTGRMSRTLLILYIREKLSRCVSKFVEKKFSLIWQREEEFGWRFSWNSTMARNQSRWKFPGIGYFRSSPRSHDFFFFFFPRGTMTGLKNTQLRQSNARFSPVPLAKP